MSENNKLTLTDCFKYPNARLEAPIKQVGVVTTIYKNKNSDSVTLLLNKPLIEYRVKITDCKLILRPLSSLTEEERKFITFNYTAIEYAEEMFDSAASLYYYIHTHLSIETTDYLRSQNIDIDNLQERGVAVYEY